MREDVCKQLRKVRTPAQGLLRGADTDIIHPSSVCTARVSIADVLYHVQFVVLSKCIAQIILGCDFLQPSEALIDCGLSELHLSSEFFEDPNTNHTVKLCLNSDVELLPNATSFVEVFPSIHIAGDVLFEAKRLPLMQKGLLLSHAVAIIENGAGWVAVDNTNPHVVVLPKGQ
ncbi:unnamed protein product [Ixodes persulcatus]